MSRLFVVGMITMFGFSHVPSSTAEASVQNPPFTYTQGYVIRITTAPSSHTFAWAYVIFRSSEDYSYRIVALLKMSFQQAQPILSDDATRVINILGTLFAAPREEGTIVTLGHLIPYQQNDSWLFFNRESVVETAWKE